MAAGSAKEDKTAGAAPPPPKSGGNTFVLILSVINLLATLGMLGVLVNSFIKDKKHPAIEDISAKGTGDAEGEGEGDKHKGKEEGKHGEHGGGDHAPKKIMNFGKMITLEQFTVNLSTPGSANSKYVRVNISLEVPNEDTETEVVTKVPQVRNVIIDLFNSKRPSDLATADGRDYLKEEIRNALNNFLVSGKIKGVFFTSFALAG